jgi:hypothetical protein
MLLLRLAYERRNYTYVYAWYTTEWYIDGQWSPSRVAIRLLAFISFSVPEWAHHNRHGVWHLNNRTGVCTDVCRNGNMYRVSTRFNSLLSNKRRGSLCFVVRFHSVLIVWCEDFHSITFTFSICCDSFVTTFLIGEFNILRYFRKTKYQIEVPVRSWILCFLTVHLDICK